MSLFNTLSRLGFSNQQLQNIIGEVAAATDASDANHPKGYAADSGWGDFLETVSNLNRVEIPSAEKEIEKVASRSGSSILKQIQADIATIKNQNAVILKTIRDFQDVSENPVTGNALPQDRLVSDVLAAMADSPQTNTTVKLEVETSQPDADGVTVEVVDLDDPEVPEPEPKGSRRASTRRTPAKR